MDGGTQASEQTECRGAESKPCVDLIPWGRRISAQLAVDALSRFAERPQSAAEVVFL